MPSSGNLDAGELPPSPDDGADLILSLPEDVLAVISLHLRPRDLLSLSAASRRLRAALAGADKPWLAQCHLLLSPSHPPPHHLLAWRAAAGSSLAVCRFLLAASPLLGLWAHQNPELGNVVAALPGFLSVVALRSLPQELSPSLLWAPVFELVADELGDPSLLFLHGHSISASTDALFPGTVTSIDPNCNTLLLEAHTNPNNGISTAAAQFFRLSFGDRRRLLDALVGRSQLKLPPELAAAPLFARSVSSQEDLPALAERREALIRMHRAVNGGMVDRKVIESLLDCGNGKSVNGERLGMRRSFSSMAGYVRDGLRQMMSRSVSVNSRGAGSAGCRESKHVPLSEFLQTGKAVGLSLRAARMRLSTYRAWPNMQDNRYALYKLTAQAPVPGREYAGLWGGTFGWPPGRPAEDEPGKALFFLLLSYEEDDEGRLLLIATKILEGTHYVLHPNGSSMFVVKVGEPVTEAFPWQTDGESHHVDVEKSFAGEGIATGYGFRYPGSKPGSLFVLQNGLLAFVWRESKAVLTLQRLDLEDLLRKGERVPALPPISNFAYLTKSYSNVFAVFHGNSSCSSSGEEKVAVK